jgi:GH15 family glucan-1,4-alpha-glucosidase
VLVRCALSSCSRSLLPALFIIGRLTSSCRPDFDSPSVFCRLLDAEKGGYFSICPPEGVTYTTKQQYLPSSNILQTRYIQEDGVVDLVDFFPRPKNSNVLAKTSSKQIPFREAITVQDELKKWLVRRVECIRGSFDLGMKGTRQ